MTQLTRIFRGLVVLQLLADLADIALGLQPHADTASDRAFDRFLETMGLSFAVSLVAGAIALLALFASASVGLLYFRNWARRLYTLLFVGLNAINFAHALLAGGTDPSSNLDSAVTSIGDIATGAILALMWASEIKNRFAPAATAQG